MIQHVQHKINTLEQEYYSNHVQSKFNWILYNFIQKITCKIGSLDDEHLSEWVPPDRPSMINILSFFIQFQNFINIFPNLIHLFTLNKHSTFFNIRSN